MLFNSFITLDLPQHDVYTCCYHGNAFKTKAINKLIRTLTYTSKKWRLTIY